MSRLVAVAVGGDLASTAAALDWALADARAPRDVVHVVHAYEPLAVTGSVWPPMLEANEQRRAAAADVLDAAVCRARARRADLDISGSLISGEPVTVLRDVSQVVNLVVVGGPDRPCPAPKGGRVGRLVAAKATGPVVVVPPANHRGNGGRRPIAILLDGRDIAPSAVEYALTWADRLGRHVVVALPWPWDCADMAEQRNLVAWETMQQERVDAELASWQATFPHVGVTVALCREPASETARRLHHSADGIVVTRNARGNQALTRFVRTALAHATCPVAVIPNSDVDQLTLPSRPTEAPSVIDVAQNVRNVGGLVR
jgi:nucleotide-binding universal stress UspA family protein